MNFLSHIDQIICKNNYQNAVFVSEALHGEIIIWNNQIFEDGYLSHPKYLGPTVWFNIQSSPKILLNLIMAMIAQDSSGQIWNESESYQILSSNICQLKKNEGRGTHFVILSYWHFAMGIDA